MKLCGACRYHDAQREICAINMAYQAFVYVYTPANGCLSWEEKKAPTVAQQSQCRPADAPADPLFFMGGVQVVQP